MRFSQNGLQLALARGIFYAETKFHRHWLRDGFRTACWSQIHQKRQKFRCFWTPGPPKIRFSQNGLHLALARGVFYAETKFHSHWLRDKLRTAFQTSIHEKRRKFRSFWTPGPPKMRFSQNGLQLALAQGIFYAETKFHWHWLRVKVRTADKTSNSRKTAKISEFLDPWTPQNAIFAKWTSTCTGPRYFLCWNQISSVLVER